MKKTTRRGRAKYPALDPALNLRSRWEEISDLDYLDQLTEDEKAWMNKFMEEYVNAKLDTKHPRKNLHRTKKGRQSCYNRNNARNRDILNRAKSSGNAVNIEGCKESEIFTLNNEETLNNKIDINNYLLRKKVRRRTKDGSKDRKNS